MKRAGGARLLMRNLSRSAPVVGVCNVPERRNVLRLLEPWRARDLRCAQTRAVRQPPLKEGRC